MVEASEVLAVLLVVSVPLPSAIVPPLPASAPMVSALLPRLNVPPLIVRTPVDRSDAPGASCSVPPLTVVPPL